MDRFSLPSRGHQPASQSLEGLLHDVRSAFQRRHDNRADVGALLELYGSITSLCARARRIRAILATRSTDPQTGTASAGDRDELVLDGLRPDEVRQFDGFHRELLDFGRCLTEVNLAAIDIYFPGLRNDLLNVTRPDIDLDYVYTHRIAPKYGLADRELPSTLVQILDRFSCESGPDNVGGQLMLEFGSNAESRRRDGPSYSPDIPTQVSVSVVLRIIELLDACRVQIRGIVQENWDFRDLLDRRPANEGGIYVAKAEYNVSGSQVGAIGPAAHVHDVAFRQHVYGDVTDIDAEVLAEQLERLQAELATKASERDHYAALVAVSDAAAEAREGKTTAAVGKLAAAGHWAADIATKIGVVVAAEAIKRATGLR